MSNKILTYICSLLVFNLLIVSILSNILLEPLTVSYRTKYLGSIYFSLLDKDYKSSEFKKIVNNIQYENIYVLCFNMDTNEIEYSNSNTIPISNEIHEKDILFSYLKNNDYLQVLPLSNLEDTLYDITGRQQQLSIIGKYKSSSEGKKVLIIQTPYAPIISITSMVSRFNVVSSILVFILSLIPTLSFITFITKPIKEATAVAKNIKNKDFSQKCIIRTNDEIAEMEEAINLMSDSIKIYTEELKNLNTSLQDDIEKQKKIELAQKEFVSNVSHEIKTPISIISGYAEGIKQGLPVDEAEREEYCNIIIDECQRMTSIVLELLTLSKLENGSTHLSFSDFCINDLCEEVMSKFRLKCHELNINLKINQEENYMVSADYSKIERVLVNYVQNAYKHVSEKGTISFILKPEGEYIYIGVNNDGAQIPENEIENLWNKFYKIDKSHKREENSTGLGLSIVKATMILHKMPYGVKNTLNGVEFFIKLKKA